VDLGAAAGAGGSECSVWGRERGDGLERKVGGRGQAAASAAAGDENEAMVWKGRLAAIFGKQGLHDEAVVCLCFFGLTWKVMLCALGIAMGNLTLTYSDLGRHQKKMPL
jgi:hypothetical protein